MLQVQPNCYRSDPTALRASGPEEVPFRDCIRNQNVTHETSAERMEVEVQRITKE